MRRLCHSSDDGASDSFKACSALLYSCFVAFRCCFVLYSLPNRLRLYFSVTTLMILCAGSMVATIWGGGLLIPPTMISCSGVPHRDIAQFENKEKYAHECHC